MKRSFNNFHALRLSGAVAICLLVVGCSKPARPTQRVVEAPSTEAVQEGFPEPTIYKLPEPNSVPVPEPTAIAPPPRESKLRKNELAQRQCLAIEAAIEAYIKHPANTQMIFPSSLMELVEKPFGGPSLLKRSEQDLLDPWGNRFQLSTVILSDGSNWILVSTYDETGEAISQYGIGKQAEVPDGLKKK